MVALPISVISSTFQDMYQEHLEGQKIVEAQVRVRDELVGVQQESDCLPE